ncbi:MAG: glycosyltransferase family 9 protein [Leptolyngbyaceae bacterium]|nr:glycosyltransferase family 9 protein [Leptolyngbyaceae bacterium]
MRIVALVPGGVSDQILFFPTLNDLKRTYPAADIDVVVEPRSKAAYRVSQAVTDVIPFDFQDRNSPADWANLLGVIRDRYYDVAIALNNGWGIGLLLWLSGTPVRIGYGNGFGGLFLTRTVPLKADQYRADQYHDVLTGLDISSPCPPLSIQLPKGDIDWADGDRSRLGLDDAGYVVIDGSSIQLPTDSKTASGYPVEKWQTIVQDFQSRQPGLPIVILHAPEDAERAAALTQLCPGIKSTTVTDIGKHAAMIAGANLVLCTESVSMHLAVALNVYTLALFGLTNPKMLLPQDDKFQAIVSPSGKMEDLAPDAVLKVVWGNAG